MMADQHFAKNRPPFPFPITTSPSRETADPLKKKSTTSDDPWEESAKSDDSAKESTNLDDHSRES